MRAIHLIILTNQVTGAQEAELLTLFGYGIIASTRFQQAANM